MALELSSVTAKLNWAEEHLKVVENEIATWMDRDLYGTSQQVNADCTRYSLILNLKGDSPPLERWSLISGDIVHNLRCALDHLIYAIAIQESGKNPPPSAGGLQFPLCDSDAAFEAALEKGILGKISNTVIAAIKRLQPYNRPHPLIPPLLSILRKFDNTDKHRLIRLAFGAFVQGHSRLGGPILPPDNLPEFVVNFGEIKDGAEIVAATFKRSAPDMYFHGYEITLQFSIHHGPRAKSSPEYLHRTPVKALLPDLLGEVREVVTEVRRWVP
jgi:hypothetical protein